jgi:anaerobic magnesium-protoporphyrin IX monomethyl ester cyclase
MVILFHPRLTPEGQNQVHFAPLSILAVASPLVRNNIDVIIIDSNFGERYEDKDIDFSKVICVGISAMTGYQIRNGLDFAQYVREYDENVPIVWGGVHVSLLPEQSIENPLVDIIVAGQGEITFLELVKSLKEGKTLTGIQGILFKKDGKVITNETRPFTDINEFPPLCYDLLDVKNYIAETKQKKLRSSDAFLTKEARFLYYCSSVGCPYRCRFCASSKMAGNKWTGLGAQRVIDEVEGLVKKYGINSLQFCDAEFFINRKRAKDIAQGFVDRKLGINWKAQVRANTFDKFDDGMMQVLKESGYTHVEIGVESGSQRMLDYINKNITVEQVIRCAEKIKKYEMFSSFCFVYGFPGETREDMKGSFKLASKLKELLPNCLIPVYFFDPFPAVPLYHESVKLGMTAPKNLEEWADMKPDMREPSPLVPWQNRKFKDKVHRVVIFYLPLAYPADIGLGTLTYVKTKMKKGWCRPIVWLGHKLALWRVKRQFFGLPFEWKLFKAWLWLKKLFSRKG